MSKLSNSWALIKASASVLRSDKQLLVFPLLSVLATLLVTAAFVAPIVAYVITHPAIRHENAGFQTPWYYVGMFVFYLIEYFVVFYMNTALVGCALVRLRGGEPTVQEGLRIARSKAGVIFGYALFASTVGMVLRSISERLGLVGRIIIGLVGLAWNVATFLVVPVLVMENAGAVGAVKRSAQMLKNTWGEQIVGNVGMDAAATLIAAPILVLFIILIVAAAVMEIFWLAAVLAVLLIVSMLVCGLVMSALGGIYTAAVYLYAADGVPPSAFTADQIQGAFRSKKRS